MDMFEIPHRIGCIATLYFYRCGESNLWDLGDSTLLIGAFEAMNQLSSAQIKPQLVDDEREDSIISREFSKHMGII